MTGKRVEKLKWGKPKIYMLSEYFHGDDLKIETHTVAT